MCARVCHRRCACAPRYHVNLYVRMQTMSASRNTDPQNMSVAMLAQKHEVGVSQLVFTMKPKLPYKTQVRWARWWHKTAHAFMRVQPRARAIRVSSSRSLTRAASRERTRSSRTARRWWIRNANMLFAKQVFMLVKRRLALAELRDASPMSRQSVETWGLIEANLEAAVGFKTSTNQAQMVAQYLANRYQ